jgi:hypothetical protein
MESLGAAVVIGPDVRLLRGVISQRLAHGTVRDRVIVRPRATGLACSQERAWR